MRRQFDHTYHGTVLVAGGLYLGLTPFLDPFGSVRLYDLKRVLEIGLLITVAASLLIVPVARERWLYTWRSLSALSRSSMWALVVIGIVSAVRSPDVHMGVLEVVHLFLLAVYVLSVAAFVQKDPQLAGRILTWVLFIAGGVYAFWFLRDYLISQLDLAYSFRRGQINALWPNGEFLGYAHPRFYNQVQSILIPLLALPVLWGGRRSYPARYLLLLVAVLWWTMVFASGSRGTIMSCGLAFAITALFYWRSSIRYYALSLLALVVGIAMFWFLFKFLGEAPESIDQRNIATSSERFELWRHAIALFLSNPVLGAGPMQYASAHATWGVHPHNAFFQFLSEWGGLATTIIIVLGLRGLASFVRLSKTKERRPADPFTKVAVTTSALAALMHAMLSGVIVMPASQVALALVLGWSLGLCLQTKARHEDVRDQHESREPAVRIVMMAVLVLAIGAEIHLAVRSFEKREELREAAMQYAQEHKRLPRFWLWGCINDYRRTEGNAATGGYSDMRGSKSSYPSADRAGGVPTVGTASR